MKLSFLLLPLLISAFTIPALAEPIDVQAPGLIVPVKQPKTMACWATAATILAAWKDNTVLTIDTVLGRAGAEYVTLFNNNTGLSGSKKPAFLSSLGFKAEAPQNFTIKGWGGLLKSNGPLWVTTAEGPAQNFSVHARVMTRVFGDGTPDGTKFTFIDPADGKEHTEVAKDFLKKFEQIAIGDLGQGADLRPQVVHF
jgi:hypothetical protein